MLMDIFGIPRWCKYHPFMVDYWGSLVREWDQKRRFKQQQVATGMWSNHPNMTIVFMLKNVKTEIIMTIVFMIIWT